MARKQFRLRYSIAALLTLVAMVAVVLSLCLPLMRNDTRQFHHGPFVSTSANAAQCAKCHAVATKKLAQLSPPAGAVSDPAGVNSPTSVHRDELLAWLRQGAKLQGTVTPTCPAAPAYAGTNRAMCASCH